MTRWPRHRAADAVRSGPDADCSDPQPELALAARLLRRRRRASSSSTTSIHAEPGAVSPQTVHSASGCRSTTINEALVWVMCALGLNIVVGYAGLLDLGYVAFWAIGGYTAGWLMSDFFYQTRSTFSLRCSPRRRDRRASTSTSGSSWSSRGCRLRLAGIIIGAPTLRLEQRLPRAGDARASARSSRRSSTTATDIHGFNISNGTQGIEPVDSIRAIGFTSDGAPTVNATSGPSTPAAVRHLRAASPLLTSSCRCASATGRLGRAWLAIREDELAASDDGRPADADQAGGVRGRCVRRRRRRRRLRRRRSPRAPDRLQLRRSRSPAGDGRARRHGQRLGRRPRGALCCLVQRHRAAAGRRTRSTRVRHQHQLPVVRLLHLRHRCWC